MEKICNKCKVSKEDDLNNFYESKRKLSNWETIKFLNTICIECCCKRSMLRYNTFIKKEKTKIRLTWIENSRLYYTRHKEELKLKRLWIWL